MRDNSWYPLLHSIQTGSAIDAKRFEEFRAYIAYRTHSYPRHLRDDIFSSLVESIVTTKTVFVPHATEKLLYCRLLDAIKKVKRQQREIAVDFAAEEAS